MGSFYSTTPRKIFVFLFVVYVFVSPHDAAGSVLMLLSKVGDAGHQLKEFVNALSKGL